MIKINKILVIVLTWIAVSLTVPYPLWLFASAIFIAASIINGSKEFLKISVATFLTSESILWNSRKIGFSDSDDIIRYYEGYIACTNNDMYDCYNFGGGGEVILSLFHAMLPNGLSAEQLLSIYLIITTLLTYAVLAKIINNTDKSKFNQIYICILLFMASPFMFYGSQIFRSQISILLLMLFLLYGKFSLIIIGVLTHGVSIIVYTKIKLINLFIRSNVMTKIIIGIFLAGMIYYIKVIEIIISQIPHDYFGRIASYTVYVANDNFNLGLNLLTTFYTLLLYQFQKRIFPIIILLLSVVLEYVLQGFAGAYLRVFPLFSVFLPIYFLYYTSQITSRSMQIEQNHVRPSNGFDKTFLFMIAIITFLIIVNRVNSSMSIDNFFMPFYSHDIHEPSIFIWL